MDYQYVVCVKCMTYNQSAFIKDALDGFCMQKTTFPYVCVIVDDSSIDGEQNVISSYYTENFEICDNSVMRDEETKDYVLKFARHRTNKNCFFAVLLLKYNHYLKKSKDPYISEWVNHSKYIALCEGDDYWTDSLKLDKQVEYMDRHPECSMCCHNAIIKNVKTGRQQGKLHIYKSSRVVKRIDLFRDGGFLPTASYLYRQNVFGDNFSVFPRHKKTGDIRIQVYASITGLVYYINETMSVYRLDSLSVTHRAMSDASIGIERQQDSIEWYKEVDRYTNGRFHYEIDSSIAFCEARILRLQGRYWKLWNPRYWSYLGYLKISTRLGLIIGMFGFSFVPKLGAYLKKKVLKQ